MTDQPFSSPNGPDPLSSTGLRMSAAGKPSRPCIPHYFGRCRVDVHYESRFFHTPEQGGFEDLPVWYYQRPPCRAWLLGHCRYKDQCQYRHPPEVLEDIPELAYRKRLAQILQTQDRTGRIKNPKNHDYANLASMYRHQVDFILAACGPRWVDGMLWKDTEWLDVMEHLKALLMKQEKARCQAEVDRRIWGEQVFASHQKNKGNAGSFVDLHGPDVPMAVQKLDETIETAREHKTGMITVCTGHHVGFDGIAHLKLAMFVYCERMGMARPTQAKTNAGIWLLRLNPRTPEAQPPSTIVAYDPRATQVIAGSPVDDLESSSSE